jgi:type I restriction enzyme S subunit
MSLEWKKVKIEQIGDVKSGKRLPLGHTLSEIKTPFPYIRLVDVNEGKIQKSNLKFLTRETRGTIKRYVVNTNDVCLAIVGHTIGMVFFVDKEWDDVNLTENAARITNFSHLMNPKYLYYYLISPSGQTQILSRKVGSAQGKLPLYNIKSLEIEIPSTKDQAEIVTILSALDDRITLLRETNATLEAIAQALFKSWFVDFDPVHAKAQGTKPEGMDEQTAALFPDSFEESELGMVPAGWEVKPLDRIANFLNGLALQKFPPTDKDWLPVIKIAQLRKGDTIGADKAGSNIKPDYIIQDGDVLFSWSGSLEVEIWSGGKGALNQHLFKVTSSDFPKWFYYFWTKHHLEHFRQISASKATTMGHIQRIHLTQAKVIVPSDIFINAVSDNFKSLLDCLIFNSVQAKTLTDLRDTLLPRLISGQLRLPDVEAQ